MTQADAESGQGVTTRIDDAAAHRMSDLHRDVAEVLDLPGLEWAPPPRSRRTIDGLDF